ncbi:MAG: hypothetical protein HUK24_06255 [Sphaerochaetaceae bacterium]|nr:hypothetical protein [Sphaerochaetaceae bacterium]
MDWQLQKANSIKKTRAFGVQDVLVTQVSRDNDLQMLGRNEHNENIAFDVLPNITLKPGDMVKVKFTGLNGNTYTGVQVEYD